MSYYPASLEDGYSMESVPFINEQKWLAGSGLHRDVPAQQIQEVDRFLLNQRHIQGIPPSFFTDPVVKTLAKTAMFFHKDQYRKIQRGDLPPHKYGKHVMATSLVLGVLHPDGQLAYHMREYLDSLKFKVEQYKKKHNYFNITDPDWYDSDNYNNFWCQLIGAGFMHDVMESDETISREQLYGHLTSQGITPACAETASYMSQKLIPGTKHKRHTPEAYIRAKIEDYKRKILLGYSARRTPLKTERVEEPQLNNYPYFTLVKAADHLANMLETTDDLKKGHESKVTIISPGFGGSLKDRATIFTLRTNVLRTYDRMNPLLPFIEEALGELLKEVI